MLVRVLGQLLLLSMLMATCYFLLPRPVDFASSYLAWTVALAGVWGIDAISSLRKTAVIERPWTSWVIALAGSSAWAGLALSPDLQATGGEIVWMGAFIGLNVLWVATLHRDKRASLAALSFATPALVLNLWLSGALISAAVTGLLWGAFILLAVRLHDHATALADARRERLALIARLSEQSQQLQTAQRRAAAADAEKTRFLAQASHDLRQPLSAALLMIEEGLSASGDPAQTPALASAGRALRSMQTLVRSFTDAAVLESGELVPDISAVRLDTVFDEISAATQSIARERGVDLRVVSNDYTVASDPLLLRRLLQNLVTNAVRHGGPAALIGARRLNTGDLYVEVRDSGRGLDPALVDSFNGNTSVASNERRRLGLFIVRRLADLLSLQVRVLSGPGLGTRFQVHGLTQADTAADLLNASPDPLTGLAVLVVEPEPGQTPGLEALDNWGCHVTRSCFGVEPKQDKAPDVVLVCGTSVRRLEPEVQHLTRAFPDAPQALLVDTPAEDRFPKVVAVDHPVNPMRLRSVLLTALARAR